MRPTIRIMMATYNGEMFIKEQIQSIIDQTYTDWSLIIQDDGSKDNTVEIIKQFRDERVSFRLSPEKKHGAYYNFHSMANQEKQSDTVYDFYMFCDQDDLWDSDKIERMLCKIEKETGSVNGREQETPFFCYADMRIINENGIIKTPSICEAQGLRYVNMESLFFSHIIYGCNTIMNRAAFFSVPILDTTQDWIGILSHDNLYAKFSGALGSVAYYPEITMGYRRHGGNVTAKQSYEFGIKRIIKRIMGINELSMDHALTYNQSLLAIRMICEQAKIPGLCDIESSIRAGGIAALRYVNRKHVYWGNRIKTVSRKAILLFGTYRKYLIIK